MSIIKKVEIGGKILQFEFQKYAKQANGSVLVSCGDTQVLVTVCAADDQNEDLDFFPLSVDYVEKFYAAGRIPGGFIKRETKPSDRETLVSRVIDRPLRPSFPKEFMAQTQIMATVLSYDFVNHPASLALIGASTALMISDIPFNGPVAGLRIGLDDGKFILDPPENNKTDLDLNIAANEKGVLMVEAGANFLTEATMIDAITYAHDLMKPIFAMQLEIQKEIGVPKRDLQVNEDNQELLRHFEDSVKAPLIDAMTVAGKKERNKAMKQLLEKVKTDLNPDKDENKGKAISATFSKFHYNLMRSMILNDKKRIDGRSYDEIRTITCETSNLKRTHGSALFTRGETQALAAVTLGSQDDEQRLDTILTPQTAKRFMLHYNFPPFSVGEARLLRAPGRREIGHGTLAERALERSLPNMSEFDYSIRLVSEVLESNGSSSMATVCAGAMALLDAGVPLKTTIAGIAMGLIKEGEQYAILSDILGDEDHLGDMDFKVTGNQEGITALQMDIKIDSLPRAILAEALDQAKRGRQHILQKIEEAITGPSKISEYAPRVFQIKVKPEKIKDVIGPGGKTIKTIVSECDAKIDVDETGLIKIISPSAKNAEEAKKLIRRVTSDPDLGSICLGKVVKVMDFGAYVEIRPGLDGLLHISQIENHKVDQVTDVLMEGQDVLVKVIDVDRQGKIKLSRKEAIGKKPTF